MPDAIQAPRIVRLAPGESGTVWAAVLGREGWSGRLATLKQEGLARVLRGPMAGREVVVKVGSMRPRDRVYAVLGLSRGQRQWRGAERLAAIGVPAAAPLVLVRGRCGRRQVECLVMPALAGRSVLEHLAAGDLSARAEHGVARRLGRQTASIAAAGMYNRDHKPSNLIVTRADAAGAEVAVEAEVAVVDTVAIRRIPPWPGAYAARMLASLVIEPAGVGVPPRRGLMARVVAAHVEGVLGARGGSMTPAQRKAARRLAWAIVERLLDRHGDPTPWVNPLARGATDAR